MASISHTLFYAPHYTICPRIADPWVQPTHNQPGKGTRCGQQGKPSRLIGIITYLRETEWSRLEWSETPNQYPVQFTDEPWCDWARPPMTRRAATDASSTHTLGTCNILREALYVQCTLHLWRAQPLGSHTHLQLLGINTSHRHGNGYVVYDSSPCELPHLYVCMYVYPPCVTVGQYYCQSMVHHCQSAV